jgi:Domain of unknown function (DUF4168)
MPEFRNSGTYGSAAVVSGEVIAKAGRAVGKICQIRDLFQERVEAARTEEERRQFTERADRAAAAVVREQGLSIEQYNQVLAVAEADTDVGERLLAAAQEPD